MKNIHMNKYLINLIQKRSIIYLIRNYKSGDNYKYESIYGYVYQNSMYAVNRQYAVIQRAYKLSHKTYNRNILSNINYRVTSATIDLLFNFYNYGKPINFDNI